MNDLTPVLVLAVLFWGIGFVVKTVSDNKLRHKLINKGMTDKNIQMLFQKPEEPMVSSSLKWGIVLVALGLAFLIGQLVPEPMTEEITIGLMFFFVGSAFLLYYWIVSRMAGKKK